MMKHENYKANTHFTNHVKDLTYVPHTHCPLVFFTPEFHYTAPITYLGAKWGMFTHLHRLDGKLYMKLTINTNGVLSMTMTMTIVYSQNYDSVWSIAEI